MAKKNKRKYAAVVLGIVGVAGLSMASASNLAIDSAPNIATGQTTIDAACDTAVSVDYDTTFNGTTYVYDYDGIDITGISATCDGLDLEWTLYYNSGSTISGGDELDATGTFNESFGALAGNSTTLDRVAITIG